ncbi:hypothetical protein [Aliivibrio fischeri]|uniref:hypothetical protein n=1 Tax=Aliivibrio fischeri TaxID=668 RepID=UPI000A88FA50|nr:hypothetical protein [Aliivibrio fischeri]
MDWKPLTFSRESAYWPFCDMKIFTLQSAVDFVYYKYLKRSILKDIEKKRLNSFYVSKEMSFCYERSDTVTCCGGLSSSLYTSIYFDYFKVHEGLPSWLFFNNPLLAKNYILRRIICDSLSTRNYRLDYFLCMNYSFTSSALPLYIFSSCLTKFDQLSCELSSMVLLGKNRPIFSLPIFNRVTSRNFCMMANLKRNHLPTLLEAA